MTTFYGNGPVTSTIVKFKPKLEIYPPIVSKLCKNIILVSKFNEADELIVLFAQFYCIYQRCIRITKNF